MKLALLGIITVGLCLAGCSSPSGPAPAPAGDSACASTASARSREARDNGYDSEIQKSIYDRVYKQCVADGLDPAQRPSSP